MKAIDRRDAIRLLALAPAAAGLSWTEAEARDAAGRAQAARAEAAAARRAYEPRFFTAHEYRTVGALADLVIPRDARSGSASDAAVPEFIDFMMGDQPARQVALRGGLAWLDHECRRRFAKGFVECADAERAAVLDDIAWPARARPEMSHGVQFFSAFRDLTATGFWTSRIGIDDLQYQGNTLVEAWTGCPEAALRKLGVTYGD